MSTRLLAEYAAMTFREVRNLYSSERSVTRSAHQAFDDAVDEVVRDLREVSARTSEVADLLDRAAVAARAAGAIVTSLTFVQRRLVSLSRGPWSRQLSGADADWQPPAIDLARIRLQPECCFEEPSNGPRW